MIPGGFWAHQRWRSTNLRMSLHHDQKLITSGLYWRKKLPRWLWFQWKPLVWGSGPPVLSCIRVTWGVSYTIEYWVAPPEFLIQQTWAKVWNVTFLTGSQVMLKCSSRDHSLRTTSLGFLALSIQVTPQSPGTSMPALTVFQHKHKDSSLFSKTLKWNIVRLPQLVPQIQRHPHLWIHYSEKLESLRN